MAGREKTRERGSARGSSADGRPIWAEDGVRLGGEHDEKRRIHDRERSDVNLYKGDGCGRGARTTP